MDLEWEGSRYLCDLLRGLFCVTPCFVMQNNQIRKVQPKPNKKVIIEKHWTAQIDEIEQAWILLWERSRQE